MLRDKRTAADSHHAGPEEDNINENRSDAADDAGECGCLMYAVTVLIRFISGLTASCAGTSTPSNLAPVTPLVVTPPVAAANPHIKYEEQTTDLLRRRAYAPYTVTNARSLFSALRPVPAEDSLEDGGGEFEGSVQDDAPVQPSATDSQEEDWEAGADEAAGSDYDSDHAEGGLEADGTAADPETNTLLPPPPAPIAAAAPSSRSMSDWQSAAGVPARKIAENTPDPFARAESEKSQRYSRSAPKGPVHYGLSMLYMLVAWLHLQFHLPFCACNIILGVVPLIARAFGAAVPPALTTLNGVLDAMDLEPNVRVFPVCPRCKEVYPDGQSTPSVCPQCSTFMFKDARDSETPATARTPLLRFPTLSLEEHLTTMLAVPGVEEACDGWRKQHRTPGTYNDNFDGKICQELPAFDGQPFFRNLPQDVDSGPDGELHIGLTLGVDW